jgi:hypothetical protein
MNPTGGPQTVSGWERGSWAAGGGLGWQPTAAWAEKKKREGRWRWAEREEDSGLG